jgi:hypothetical protein
VKAARLDRPDGHRGMGSVLASGVAAVKQRLPKAKSKRSIEAKVGAFAYRMERAISLLISATSWLSNRTKPA